MGTTATTRTFESVKLKFLGCLDVSQTDSWTGETIPREKATETLIAMEAELEFRGLTQGFNVRGKIREKGFAIDRLEAKIKRALVVGMPKGIVSDFFRPTEITVKSEDANLDAPESEAQMDEIHAARLEEQAKMGNEASDSWKAAIEDMIDGLKDGYEFNRKKVRDGMMVMEWSHRAANNWMMQSWCDEKISRIRDNLGKLAKYKSCSHPNAIRTAQEIQRLLRDWPVVNSWRDQPPRRPSRA